MSDHPIALIMGSQSDWHVMRKASEILDEFDIAYDKRIISAHRTSDRLYHYAKEAKAKGVKIIIAGAGGAAHLPGMLAAQTALPVLGVPIATTHFSGMDSLLSIVQMPKGVPVGTLAVDGAENAALLALRIISLSDKKIADQLDAWQNAQTQSVPDEPRS